MNKELEMNPNKLVAALGKPSKEFTKADIVAYIKQNDMVKIGLIMGVISLVIGYTMLYFIGKAGLL